MPSSKQGARARREGLRTRMPASGGRVVSPPTCERVADALAWELRCVCRAAVEGVDRRVGCAEAFTVLRARQIVPSGWHEPLAPVFRVADRPRPLPTLRVLLVPRTRAHETPACVRAVAHAVRACMRPSGLAPVARNAPHAPRASHVCRQACVRACARAEGLAIGGAVGGACDAMLECVRAPPARPRTPTL